MDYQKDQNETKEGSNDTMNQNKTEKKGVDVPSTQTSGEVPSIDEINIGKKITLPEEADYKQSKNWYPPAYHGDRNFYRIIAGILGLTIFCSLGVVLTLLLTKVENPPIDGLIALGSAAVGALAGVLAGNK